MHSPRHTCGTLCCRPPGSSTIGRAFGCAVAKPVESCEACAAQPRFHVRAVFQWREARPCNTGAGRSGRLDTVHHVATHVLRSLTWLSASKDTSPAASGAAALVVRDRVR